MQDGTYNWPVALNTLGYRTDNASSLEDRSSPHLCVLSRGHPRSDKFWSKHLVWCQTWVRSFSSLKWRHRVSRYGRLRAGSDRRYFPAGRDIWFAGHSTAAGKSSAPSIPYPPDRYIQSLARICWSSHWSDRCPTARVWLDCRNDSCPATDSAKHSRLPIWLNWNITNNVYDKLGEHCFVFLKIIYFTQKYLNWSRNLFSK